MLTMENIHLIMKYKHINTAKQIRSTNINCSFHGHDNTNYKLK